MANLPNQEPDFNPAPADMTPIAPLGIKNPLLPPNPLGQSFLSPKFLSPLGAKPLASMRPLAFSHQEMPGYGLSETSFFDTSVLENFPLSLSRENESVQSYEGSLESGTVEATISNSTLVQPFSGREVSQERRTTVQELRDSTPTPVETESVTTESEAGSTIYPVPTVTQPTVKLQPSDKIEDVFLATPQAVETAPPTELISEVSSVHSSLTTPESVPDNFCSERSTVIQTVSETKSPQQRAAVVPDITELQTRSQPTELQPEANVVLSPLLQEPSSSITTSTTTESIVQSQEADSPIASATTETKLTPQPVVQAFTEDLLTQSNSVETTPTIEQLIQSQEVDSSITFATTETTPTPQPIVQSFAEDLSTQSNSAETTPNLEPLVQPQETDSPIASVTTETTPTPQPIVQAFAEDLSAQSSSNETTPNIEPIIQPQPTNSPIISAVTETTPTPQPVVQAFAEDLLTQSNSVETTPTVEQLIQPQETDSPIASATTEITPTPQPVVQAFAEDLLTQSSSNETTPTVESLVQSQEADSPIASVTTETTPTPQPVVQAFTEDLSTQSNSVETTPNLEPLVQPETTDSSTESAEETTPTLQPIVQLQAIDSPTQFNQIDSISTQPSILPAFLETSSAESASTETIPIQKPVVQAFRELVTDEFETENLTSPEQILVQSFSETEIIPQLPTVLENLAPLQPLGSAKPLAQQSDFLLGVSSDDGAGEQLFNLQSKPAELQASQKSVIPASFEPVPVESVAAEAPPMRRLLDPAFLESTSTNSTAVGNDTLPFENDLIDRAIATPPHTTSSPSITENTTSIEPTIVQAVSETATFPELPTVLENLALLQPLSSAKPLAQQSNFPLGTSPTQQSQEQSNHLQQQPTQGSGDAFKEKENASKRTLSIVPVPPITLNHKPFILQRFVPDANQDRTAQPNQEIQPLRHSTPTGNIPNSWSSITELLGESRTDSISTNSQETLIQRVNNPSSTLEALDLAVNASGTTSQYSSSYDSPLVLGTDTSSSAIEQNVVSNEVSSGENSSQQTDSKNLELLAREIYSLLRQRLEIERERRGSYYSDRFP
jgi:hypothetical protein